MKSLCSKVSDKLLSLLKACTLLVICTLLAAAAAFPLYKFAVSSSAIYTTAVLTAFTGLFIYWFYTKIRQCGFIPVLKVFLYILISLAGASLIIWLVLTGKRLFALPVLLISAGLIVLIKIFIKGKK